MSSATTPTLRAFMARTGRSLPLPVSLFIGLTFSTFFAPIDFSYSVKKKIAIASSEASAAV
jgi:hypothetical protein